MRAYKVVLRTENKYYKGSTVFVEGGIDEAIAQAKAAFVAEHNAELKNEIALEYIATISITLLAEQD